MESGESIGLIDSEVIMFYLYVQFSKKNFELDVFRQPCRQSTKPSKRLTLRNFLMTRPDTIMK